MKKEFEFEDGSKLSLEFMDQNLAITLQARHPGKELKITSASVLLSEENVVSLVNLLGNKLLGEQ